MICTSRRSKGALAPQTAPSVISGTQAAPVLFTARRTLSIVDMSACRVSVPPRLADVDETCSETYAILDGEHGNTRFR